MSRTNKADHPRERVMMTVVREPIQPDGLAPLKVLQRVDGPHIVFDPALPPGKRTAGGQLYPSYAVALAAAWERKAASGKDSRA